MDGINFTDEQIQKLIDDIYSVADKARNEEELKINIEILLDPIKRSIGINWTPYEEGVKYDGGRKDAVYGTLILEYKAPGALSSKINFSKYKKRLKEYIEGEGKDSSQLDLYLGVLFDGRSIAFIRYNNGTWDETDTSFNLNIENIKKLFLAMSGLKRKPITPENLVLDFGPKSKISIDFVSTLYERLEPHKDDRIAMLYDDWRRVFSQVCSFSPKKLSSLGKYYPISSTTPVNSEKLMFCIHTYYTFVMKLLTSEMVSIYHGSSPESFLYRLDKTRLQGGKELFREFENLEQGGIFNLVGIKNFIDADYFSWYLNTWDGQVEINAREVIRILSDYEPATVVLKPEKIRDLFKQLYQELIPKTIRHKMGEYFTPDWLAELLLDEVGYDNHTKSLLDPSCGSGTFITSAIGRVKAWAKNNNIPDDEALLLILQNIKGIDLNPLAVLASKANYIIAVSDLLKSRPSIGVEIPIFHADSIFVGRKVTFTGSSSVYLNTIVGEFILPVDVINNNFLEPVLSAVGFCVKNQYSKNEFKQLVNKDFPLICPDSVDMLVELFVKISDLNKKGKNGIWTNILKNSFAPLTLGKFDLVVGNPPWINWENLPDYYRKNTKSLWESYGLTSTTKGMGQGKTKRDMAMLFTARCLDRYTKNGGICSFLTPLTTYKTAAGAGFRKFISEGKFVQSDNVIECNVLKIHDLVELSPFEGATNRASMFVIKKEGRTRFPIPGIIWRNKDGKKVSQSTPYSDLYDYLEGLDVVFAPIIDKKPETPWMTITKNAEQPIRKAIGPSSYSAHEGVNSGLNGAFWCKVKSKSNTGLLVENLNDVGKIKLKLISGVIEKDLLYPLLRGQDLSMWYWQQSNDYIVVPHLTNGKVINEGRMKIDYRHAYQFLLQLKKELVDRSIYQLWGKGKEFYSLYDISDYTFSNYKVMWRYVSGSISAKGDLQSAVVCPINDDNLGSKIFIPNEKLMFISVPSEKEAYFICGILNSKISRTIAASYTIETQISTHVLEYIKVPQYNEKNDLHKSIVQISKKIHELVKEEKETTVNNQNAITALSIDLDKVTSQIFGINAEDLISIIKAYEILKPEKCEIAESDEDEDVEDE